MRSAIRKHMHFILVTAFLIVVMTFPTIIYVFNADAFWLPAKHCCDALQKLWDAWYVKQIFTAQADLLFTDRIFYPDGASLTYHPLFLLHGIAVYALQLFMPPSNAYSTAYLLMVFSTAFAAYGYLNWLFKDRWPALLGAVIFGFCPQVLILRSWPEIAWLAPVPIIIYGVHRGITEKRAILIIMAGLTAGLTSTVSMYLFVCIVVTQAFFVCALALSRWRDRVFQFHILLLLALTGFSCAWRVVPMLQDAEQIDRASGYTDSRVDLISFFVNEKHPVLGPLAKDLLQIPEKPKTSEFSYIGLAPIALICFGLFNKRKRRQMLPWLGLLLLFLILSLGSTLSINGIAYENIKLPKHFLNQLLPPVFAAFYRPDVFMTGAWLPLAVLSGLGLQFLLDRIPINMRSRLVLAIALIVAFEYYSPIPELAKPQLAAFTTKERLAFLDWLESEPQSEISLINLPFGKFNSLRYSFFQSLSGYPQVEGYLSRTPNSAYDYIGANFLLNAWQSRRPMHCEMTDQEAFLSGLAQLEEDGFSHVVFHRDLNNAQAVSESFRNILPAYRDRFVFIFRLSDLRDGCPEELSARHHFTRVFSDALKRSPAGHETLVLFPPTPEVSDHFMRYLRHFDPVDKNIVAIATDAQGQVDIWSTTSIDPERQNAVWVLKERQGLAPEWTSANSAWFLQRFKFCEQIYTDATIAVDLYVKLSIPCTALDSSSALEIHYLDGVRLHNAYMEVDSDRVRFYLAWTRSATKHYSFSIQLFDVDGQKTIQHDSVIQSELLTSVEIETAQLPQGLYVVKLIVYEFDTGKSQPGTVQATMQRFEREFDLAKIEL